MELKAEFVKQEYNEEEIGKIVIYRDSIRIKVSDDRHDPVEILVLGTFYEMGSSYDDPRDPPCITQIELDGDQLLEEFGEWEDYAYLCDIAYETFLELMKPVVETIQQNYPDAKVIFE